MTFATSGEEAVEILKKTPQDVLVSDRRMPHMDGENDCSEFNKRWPNLVRLTLSGQSDEESTLRSIGAVRGTRPESSDPALLRLAVQRAVALHHLLQDERVKVVVTRMDTLPSIPILLHELMAELEKEECSLVRVGEIVSQDVAMTAKVLRLVNSAYFGLRFEVSNADMAVRYLGINAVSTLVMICHIFQHADKELASWLDLDRIWRHSLTTSLLARKIAELESGERKLADDSLGAGMLHDAGRLVLAVNFPETYRGLLETAIAEKLDLVELERSVLGVTHAEVGAYLMGTWGLSDDVVEAIAYHHNPRDCVHRRFSPLTAVHVACATSKVQASTPESPVRDSIDEEYLAEIELLDRLDEWRGLGLQVEDGDAVKPF